MLPSASRTAVCSRNLRSRTRQLGSGISSPGSRGTPSNIPIRLPLPWKAITATSGRSTDWSEPGGWRLFNVNNLKLARFKEIFPAAAKSDRIDSVKTLELFQLRDHLPMAAKKT